MFPETPQQERRKIVLSKVEQQTYARLVKEYKDSAIKPEDFSDLYGPDVIKQDTNYVARMEDIFSGEASDESKELQKRAEILEAILAEQIELGEWFGPDALTINTSRFDDIRNKIDMAVEFQREEGFQHLALSIDVTSSATAVAEKLKQICQEIKRGELTRIKYFLSEKSDIRGELGNIPRIIVGADAKTIFELSELWVTANNLKIFLRNGQAPETSEETILSVHARLRKALADLSEHRIQTQLLLQIEMQLRYFIELAEKNKQPVVAQKYKNTLDLIEIIIKIKQIPRYGAELIQDNVFQAIRSFLKTQ